MDRDEAKKSGENSDEESDRSLQKFSISGTIWFRASPGQTTFLSKGYKIARWLIGFRHQRRLEMKSD
jgi:hypothetical protein